LQAYLQYDNYAEMRKLLASILISIFVIPLITQNAFAKMLREEIEQSGLVLHGFVNAGLGWQHFSHDPVTEKAIDGSFAGPLGELIPDVQNNTIPTPGQDNFQFMVQLIELDIKKRFGDRAKLRADLQFGRVASGSSLAGFYLEHAYLEVLLSKKYNVQLAIGRMGTMAGFEPYDDYYNDTISWSIIWRGLIAGGVVTGLRLSADFSDHFSFYFSLVNGFIRDEIPKVFKAPTVVTSFVINWGEQDKQSSFILTPFFGAESDSARHFTMGCDATLTWWFDEDWQLGLEGVYQRDNGNGGPNTDYLAGLMNLHWDVTERWYGVLKYVYANQFDLGNGVINLTGTKQQIHEMSLGGGYYIADSAKLKLEGRMDVVNPDAGSRQLVYGVATALAYAF
jgi:hypothetical protein